MEGGEGACSRGGAAGPLRSPGRPRDPPPDGAPGRSRTAQVPGATVSPGGGDPAGPGGQQKVKAFQLKSRVSEADTEPRRRLQGERAAPVLPAGPPGHIGGGSPRKRKGSAHS